MKLNISQENNTGDCQVVTAMYIQYSADGYSMNPDSADRPKFSVLENYMFKLTGGYQFAEWQDAIAKYIGEM